MQNKQEYMHPSDQIVAFMQRIYDRGMTTTSGGNLSIMDDNGDMWISPSGIDKGTLRREDIICVKADGTIIGPHKPSSEFPFHSAIYKMRHDVRAILHAHPPALVSFSVAGKLPDLAAFPAASETCGSVGFAPYEVPGSEALGKNVAAVFADGHNTALLENHGCCLVGTSMQEAYQRLETLDFCARILCGAVQLKGSAVTLSKADLMLASEERNGIFTEKEMTSHLPEELELRRTMSLLVQRSYRQSLFISTEGTFAVRLSGGKFLITPHGCDRASIQPEEMILVDGCTYQAGKTLSRNTWLVKSIFDAQPDLKSVMIANPPHLMSYAVSNEPFDPRVIPESYILLREMPAFDFRAKFNQTDKLISTLSIRYPVVLLQNDCIISCGKTPLESYDRMEVAEYSAKATVSASFLGGMKPIDEKQIADLVDAFHLIP